MWIDIDSNHYDFGLNRFIGNSVRCERSFLEAKKKP